MATEYLKLASNGPYRAVKELTRIASIPGQKFNIEASLIKYNASGYPVNMIPGFKSFEEFKIVPLLPTSDELNGNTDLKGNQIYAVRLSDLGSISVGGRTDGVTLSVSEEYEGGGIYYHLHDTSDRSPIGKHGLGIGGTIGRNQIAEGDLEAINHTVSIDNLSVSRTQAAYYITEGDDPFLLIVDGGSTNGTRLKGKPIIRVGMDSSVKLKGAEPINPNPEPVIARKYGFEQRADLLPLLTKADFKGMAEAQEASIVLGDGNILEISRDTTTGELIVAQKDPNQKDPIGSATPIGTVADLDGLIVRKGEHFAFWVRRFKGNVGILVGGEAAAIVKWHNREPHHSEMGLKHINNISDLAQS